MPKLSPHLFKIASLVCIGLLLGFVWAIIEGGASPIWLLPVAALVFLFGWLMFKPNLKPDEEVGFHELMWGDMRDPKQRGIMIRVAIAAAIHGITISQIANIDPGSAIIHEQMINFGLFVVTLIWMIVECWRFYLMDEFWRELSLPPLAISGVVLFFVATVWGAATIFSFVPPLNFLALYIIYWVTLCFLLIRNAKMMTGE